MRHLKPRPLTTRPRISVVIPCYNYGHFLPEAVASALDQPGVDVDVLIVDDASTDDSAAVAQRLAASDPRVDVLLHEQNRGHIQTYNDGLEKVTGDYVVLLSADDVLTPGSLARAAALMEAHPGVGLVYGRIERFRDSPPAIGPQAVSWTVWSGHDWIRRTCRRAGNMIMSPEAVMRRSLLEALGGGYDAAHPHAADMLLWVRAAARMDVGRVNGPVQACYRLHGDNMHSTTFDGDLTDLRHVRGVFEVFFSEHPDPVLQSMAMRGLAREAVLTALYLDVVGAPTRPLFAFAQECDGVVGQRRIGRRYLRRTSHGVGLVETAAEHVLHRARWRVRGFRWSRWGT